MTAENPGEHRLPGRFSGTGTFRTGAQARLPASDRLRLVPKWVSISVACITLGTVAIGGMQLVANLQYDQAHASFIDAAANAGEERNALQEQLATTRATFDAATQVADADLGLLGTAPVLEHLQTAITETAAELTALETKASEPLPTAPTKPTWAWDLLPAASTLQDVAAATADGTNALTDATAVAQLAHTALQDAAVALAAAATDTAPAFEQEHRAARNPEVLELRAALHATTWEFLDDQFAEGYARLNIAASAVAVSAAEEIAEKAGPLYDRRLEVEAYARSISGGVLLDFNWAPLVNGRGLNGSAGGTATWNSGTGFGGFSTITLSDSVAELWPSDVMRALVTHEVGHAITAKCYTMFDNQDRDANEAWATAWALSQGHTADGNGVSIYGYPPQELIELAATCR